MKSCSSENSIFPAGGNFSSYSVIISGGIGNLFEGFDYL